jgi:hypothetical protein
LSRASVRALPGSGPQKTEVTVDEVRIPPAGDGFHAKGLHGDHDHPHACYSGTVYIGHLVEEEGEEVEAYEAIPCRRCAPTERKSRWNR